MHAVVETGLNRPAVQILQVVAPVDASLLVAQPAGQSPQGVCELLLNLPAVHAVQLLAPVLLRVSVTKPALQVVHDVTLLSVL